MKKLFFFIAALMLSFTAQAKVVECTPNTNAIAWWLTQGDTLVLADGEYLEAYSIDFDKPGVCVKAAEGAKPIIKLTGEWTALEVTATTTFDGITFDAGNVAQYIIATLDSTTFETDLTIKNCEFKNWNKWAISHYYQKNVSVNSIVIDNCLFHDAKNSAVYFSENAPEGKNACQDLKITNSTFYNIGDESAYTTVYCVGGNAVEAQKVTVDYCTFYNCQAKNTDHAAVRITCAATISNTIIAAPASQGNYRAIHAADGSNAQAINCLTYNYEKDNGGIRSGATKTDCQLNVDPKFDDAANGNFALEDGSPALGAGTDGSNLGDPRWNAPAVEEPAGIEVVLEDAYKEVYLIWNRANFIGTHATYGNISVQVNNYNGYGTYAEGVSSRIGDVRVNGSATFENKGETDLLTATLTDEEGTVYIVKAEVPTPKTYEVVATNAAYVNVDQGGSFVLTVNGLTVGEEELTLTVYWDGVGGSEEGYEASAGFEGSIQGMIFVDKGEDDVLSFEGTLKDASDNSYIFDFEATPKAPETYALTFEDMVIEPGQWDDNLHITAENEEYAIEFQLFGGKTKGYGEYGFTDDYPDVDEIYINFEYATMAEGTVANYYLNEDTRLATIELTVVLGIDTYNITLTGQPLVNPEDIKPTDTINITMTEATIGLYMGMPKVAASSNEAELSIVLVGENPYLATVEDFSAASYLVTTAGSLTFLRGGLEIVEVGDVKIAYIGVLCSDHKWYNITLTTGTELPTALDNIDTTVAPAKVINNGQLIIIRNGVQYNAQGAIVK